MDKRDVLRYLAALLVVFCLGCGAALGLRAYDAHMDSPAPLTGGQTLDLAAFGFTLRAPESFTLYDVTQDNLAAGGDALFAGCAAGDGQALYFYCYGNEQGDDIGDYGEQELVTYYTGAGCSAVRTREFGGRRFICYSAQVERDGEIQTWHSFETWDERMQLVFETQMAQSDVLPMLATLQFN